MKKKSIIIAALVVLAVILAAVLMSKEENAVEQSSNANIITTRKTFLSPDNYAFVEKRLAERYTLLANLPDEAAVGDRLNLYVSIASDEIGLGNLAKGKEYYEKALALEITEPEKGYVYQRLSSVLVEMNDFDASIDAINKAIAISPGEPEYWKWLIAVRHDRYSYSSEQLKELYEDALKKTGNNGEIKSVYVKFLTELGDEAEAARVNALEPTGFIPQVNEFSN